MAVSQFDWEFKKIGGATPPIKMEKGWLTLYHGVDRGNIYRTGVMFLDLDDPSKVIARASEPVLEPQEYYEKFGLFIPNVVFPTGNVVKDGTLYIYYGCCDTAISLGTVELNELLDFVLAEKFKVEIDLNVE